MFGLMLIVKESDIEELVFIPSVARTFNLHEIQSGRLDESRVIFV